MGSLPPVANAALAFGAGVALTRFGALWSIAPLIGSVLVFLPIHLSRRPSQSWVWLPLLLAGLFAGSRVSGEPECVTDRSALVGRFLADPVGGSAPFRVEASRCEVRVVLGQQSAPAGHRVVLDGAWQEGRFPAVVPSGTRRAGGGPILAPVGVRPVGRRPLAGVIGGPSAPTVRRPSPSRVCVDSCAT